MKRIGYRKSRNGCTRCKARRVKCDEKRPCTACAKRSLPCSLDGSGTIDKPLRGHSRTPTASPPPTASCTEARLASNRSRNSALPFRCRGQFSNKGMSPATTPWPTCSGVAGDVNDAAPWVTDLELMHHYTTVGCLAISNTGAGRTTLRDDLPRLGLANPPLMHQLLSYSAYHLAHVHADPCRRGHYAGVALRHQNVAIRRISAMLGADGVTRHNCHTLFASAILLSLSRFAMLSAHGSPADPVDGIVSAFALIRGIDTILAQSLEPLSTGPLRGFFRHGAKASAADGCVLGPYLASLPPRLDALDAALAQAPALAGSGCARATRGAVLAMLEAVRAVLAEPEEHKPELKLSFAWPALVPGDFLPLVARREPAAMVVLAYYCPVVQEAETDLWTMAGWARSLAGAVSASVKGTVWEESIQFPLSWIKGEDRTMC